jgi:serine/threonine-protein kinase
MLKSTFKEELHSTAQKQETFPNRSLESMIIPPPMQSEAEILPPIRLRSEPLMVLTDEFRDLFKLDTNRRPWKYIRSDFEEQGEVVIDQATGLMWQKSGSNEPLAYEQAWTYIQQLNDERFAGHDDWRLPTTEELLSLLEPEKQTNGLYIKPIFDRRQPGCWSADTRSSESAWRVRFSYGDVHWHSLTASDYVRGVRF